MLLTAGLYDTQVLYVEPAKWTARLRAMKTDNNRLMLRTNMEVPAARRPLQALAHVAFEYAFLLDLAGLGPPTRAPPIRKSGSASGGPWGRWKGARSVWARPYPSRPSLPASIRSALEKDDDTDDPVKKAAFSLSDAGLTCRCSQLITAMAIATPTK